MRRNGGGGARERATAAAFRADKAGTANTGGGDAQAADARLDRPGPVPRPGLRPRAGPTTACGAPHLLLTTTAVTLSVCRSRNHGTRAYILLDTCVTRGQIALL